MDTPFCQRDPKAKSRVAHSVLFSCASANVGMAVQGWSGVNCWRANEHSVERGPHSRKRSYPWFLRCWIAFENSTVARATVEFSKAIQHLKNQGYDLFLECGPRSTLCSLARQQFTPDHPCTAIPTFADAHENNTEWATLLFALGSLWQNGVSIDWDAFYANEDRRRIPLPTYPFERQRFWVDPAPVAPA